MARGFLRNTCKRYMAFTKQITWIVRSFDLKEARKGTFVDVVFAKRLKITKKDI